MVKDILQRVGFGAVAVILAAFAGGIAFVALAYGLFALLAGLVSSAGAAAITALVFALVAAGLAILVPKVAPKKADVAALKPKLDQRTLAVATEVGVAALGIVGDLLVTRRLKRQAKARRFDPKTERIVRIEDGPAPDRREAELRKSRKREEKALKARKRAEKNRHRAEKKLRAVRLKQLIPHHH
jgi:hypothetical protein